jgi:hypothetical protein
VLPAAFQQQAPTGEISRLTVFEIWYNDAALFFPSHISAECVVARGDIYCNVMISPSQFGNHTTLINSQYKCPNLQLFTCEFDI